MRYIPAIMVLVGLFLVIVGMTAVMLWYMVSPAIRFLFHVRGG